MSNLSSYQFGIHKADVAAYNNGAAVTTWTNIPVLSESNIAYKIASAEVQDGEGVLQYLWRHSQRATITLKLKRFSYRVLEIITNSPVSSGSSVDRMEFGVTQELNPPQVRLRLQQLAYDPDGNTTGYTQVIVYKAQGALPGFDMPEAKPAEYSVVLECLQSTKDELGNTIPGAYFRVSGVSATLN